MSRAAAGYWCTGAKKPGPAKREILREWLGIDPTWWDEYPKASATSSSPAAQVAAESSPTTPPAAKTSIPVGSLAMAAELEKRAQRMMQNLENDPLVTPLEEAKVMASIAGTLNLLAKLTGEYELGRRLFKLPIWQRIRAAHAAGLKGHPQAAAQLARELERLEAEHGGVD